jgi:hypothetical protein
MPSAAQHQNQLRVWQAVQACLSAPCTALASVLDPFAVKAKPCGRYAALTVPPLVVAPPTKSQLKKETG